MENIGGLILQFIENNKTVLAAALIDMNGNILWQTDNWTLSGPDVISCFKERNPSITIQGIKYSMLTISEDSLIAMNMEGQGYIIGAPINSKALLIVYSTAEGDPKLVYTELSKLAYKIKETLNL